MATKSVMNATLTEYQHQKQQPQLVRRIKRKAQRKKRAKASSYTIIWLCVKCAQVDMQSPISVLEFHNNVQRTAGGTLCNACIYVYTLVAALQNVDLIAQAETCVTVHKN